MSEIIWKGFKLGELFERKTPPSTDVPAKELNIFDEELDNTVALITRSATNNGKRGYILKENFPTLKNSITFNDQFSVFLYHEYEFTTIKDHLSILEARNHNFSELLLKNNFINYFLVILLNHTFSKKIFNFNFTGADYRFDREIILLPCIEVEKVEESIWQEDGKFFTLATEYIKTLMESAKELREQKTIRLYEAERAKYEAERAKYEAEYLKEKENVVWKRFTLGDLFERSTKLAISMNQKDLNLVDEHDSTHSVALISASRNGSGRVGYIENDIVDESLISINKITFDDQWGYTYFQKENFVITGGHNAILEVKNSELKDLLDNNLFIYSFLSLIMNKITIKSDIFGYGYKINNKFDREIILLPCIEVEKVEESIWQEDGKFFTLATNFISYLYLSGRVNHNQKLIENYTYHY